MSVETAQELAALIDVARDSFVSDSEAELERFHTLAGAVLIGSETADELNDGLNLAAAALLLALTTLWTALLSDLLSRAHSRVGLGPAPPYSYSEAEALMRPGVANLVNAALMTARTSRGTRLSVASAWRRQLDRGGAFTALRGAIRGATAGTFNLLVNASMIDTAKEEGGWILGAYNPLDERTAAIDRALCTNTGESVRTARGRTVRSIPGLFAKYSPANAWLPGPPRSGGDTHDGCRCMLIPERLEN